MYSLPADEAAIYQEVDAGTERRCLAREKDRRANHLVDGRDPREDSDDAFEVRTTLRLNVALGALPPPTYNQPLK